MTYSELVNMVEQQRYPMTRWDVIRLLLEKQGMLDWQDFENIIRLSADGFIG